MNRQGAGTDAGPCAIIKTKDKLMHFVDKQLLDALSLLMSHIEKSKQNLSELKSENPRNPIRFVLSNWIKELPDDFPLELIASFGQEVKDLADEFQRKQKGNQLETNYDYLGILHIEKDSKPLCNQDGVFLNLCTIEDFKKLPSANRCTRCERLIGLKQASDWLYPLSEKQKGLLAAIFTKTKGDKDSWCFVTELSEDKSDSGRTSLHRRLRKLQRRGYIEKKLNTDNRALVRLTDRGYHEVRQGKILFGFKSDSDGFPDYT